MKAKSVKMVVVLSAALVLAALAVPASASVVPATQIKTSYGQNFTVNYDNISVWLDGIASSVILGQDVQFYNATGNFSGVVTLVGITGISNREGRSINVKVTGPADLGKKTVTVTNGVFTAMFNTSGALPGEYTVEVDERDGHTDTTSVNITAAISVTPAPTPTVAATATPTPEASIPTPVRQVRHQVPHQLPRYRASRLDSQLREWVKQQEKETKNMKKFVGGISFSPKRRWNEK